MIRAKYRLISVLLVSIGIGFLGVHLSFGCDLDKIEEVWIAPWPVWVPAGDRALVVSAVQCRATSDEQGHVEFKVRLVDDDGLETGGFDPLTEKIPVSATMSLASTVVPVVAATVSPLDCGIMEDWTCQIMGEVDSQPALSGEGYLGSPWPCTDPAELTLEIDAGGGASVVTQ